MLLRTFEIIVRWAESIVHSVDAKKLSAVSSASDVGNEQMRRMSVSLQNITREKQESVVFFMYYFVLMFFEFCFSINSHVEICR